MDIVVVDGGEKHAFVGIACFIWGTGVKYTSKTSFANVSSICNEKVSQHACVIPMPGFKDCGIEMEVKWELGTKSAHGALFLLVEPLDCDSFWQLMCMSHMPAFTMPLQQEFVAVRAPRDSASTPHAAVTLALFWHFSSFGQVDLTGSSLAKVWNSNVGICKPLVRKGFFFFFSFFWSARLCRLDKAVEQTEGNSPWIRTNKWLLMAFVLCCCLCAFCCRTLLFRTGCKCLALHSAT